MNFIYTVKRTRHSVPYSHIYLFLITIFTLILGQLSAEIIYTDFPADMQLYGRNTTTNQALVTVSGISEGASTGSSVQLKVYRAGVIHDTKTQTLNYQNNKANFQLQVPITAELVNYRFEFYTLTQSGYKLDKTAINVVAGDVYIIDGQSNALATQRAESASNIKSPFIRSFASGVNNINVNNNLNWYQGNADGSYSVNGNVGQFGIKMARLLMDQYQIPIAIFNGAYGGSSISYHARNNNNPTDLATNYGRLLYRLQKAKVADKVRAIIWYQGESDGKIGAKLLNYKGYFHNMYDGWENDFPNFEKLYIMQIRTSCSGLRYYFARVQEAQRQLAHELPKATLMTAKGIPLWSDDCHYAYLDGYQKIAERVVDAVKNDMYGANTPHVLPPNIANAEIIAPDTLMITTTNPADVLTWEQGAEDDFYLIGASTEITSGRTSGNRIYLSFTGNASAVYGVTYFGRNGAGVTSPYIKNSVGIGMATFFDFPVGDPVLNVSDDNFAVNEDGSLIGDISTNDFAANNSGWTLSPLVSSVSSGSLSLDSDGDFSYIPNSDFNGEDTFVYEICSAARPDYCKQATAYITVIPTDDAPIAIDDAFSILQNNIAYGNIHLNDNEIDGDEVILNTTPVTSPSNGQVTVQSSGDFVYTPNTGFYGVDEFTYQICDVTPATLCDTARVSIFINVNAPNNSHPIAVNDQITLNEDAVKSRNLLVNDSDPDGDDITLRPTPLTLPIHGDAIVNAGGLSYYLPDPNFYGIDSFSYEICDNGFPSLCDTAWVAVNVLPINDLPFAMNDTIYNNAFDASSINILDNDSDPENDVLNITSSGNFASLQGDLVIQNNGVVNYQPHPGFFGVEQFNYEICDNGTPIQCDEATVTIIVKSDCIHLDIQTFIEGAYNEEIQQMSTFLNTERGLLPGQTPASNLMSGTPAGQPYHVAPWNYNGQEGQGWTDDNYEEDMVDWVLVSFRLSANKNSEIAQTAAILRKDGQVYFPDRCVLSTDLTAPVYVLVEHRNHIGAMSPQATSINNQTLKYDFRAADSYKDASGYGQKQVSQGVWTLITGDSNQTADEFSYDINGDDKQIWYQQNGVFDTYSSADYDLDGDVNGQDKTLWSRNNGISSRVPK